MPKHFVTPCLQRQHHIMEAVDDISFGPQTIWQQILQQLPNWPQPVVPPPQQQGPDPLPRWNNLGAKTGCGDGGGNPPHVHTIVLILALTRMVMAEMATCWIPPPV